MVTASLLDRLVGDPRQLLHPVEVMGWWIGQLRRLAEAWALDCPWKLRLAGGLITLLMVGGSGAAGWWLERLAPGPLLVVALASALAGRSLEQAVQEVVKALPRVPDDGQPAQTPRQATTAHGPQTNQPREIQAKGSDAEESLELARQKLSWIVGRDVDQLNRVEILRACAETASENAVDGVFGPLFWMLVGVVLWQIPGAPGPLSLAWGFKATSTLDSMLGYRRGRLRWLGTAGARLDDLLTWLPCRLVAFSLPLVGNQIGRSAGLARLALQQGRSDPSPNSGVSQAIYALVVEVQLGGRSRYGGQDREKPLVGVEPTDGIQPQLPQTSVEEILALTSRLQALWLTGFGAAAMVACITKTLS